MVSVRGFVLTLCGLVPGDYVPKAALRNVGALIGAHNLIIHRGQHSCIEEARTKKKHAYLCIYVTVHIYIYIYIYGSMYILYPYILYPMLYI